MKKLNSGLWIIGVLCCGMLLGGCGVRREEGLSLQEQNLTVVGVSQVGSESVWRTANTKSIQKIFSQQNGYFLDFQNARQKQENQIKAIRGFISRQVDYIVFSPITEHGWETVLQEAKDAKIPVILMDRQVDVKDDSLYTSWVGSDFYEEGRKAGRELEKIVPSKAELSILVLTGTEGATSAIGRSRGFYEIAAKHSNWKILAELNGEYTTTKGKEVMKGALRNFGDIDVIISQNDDMTFGALEAIEEAGLSAGQEGDVIFVSFDASKTALELVKEGKISIEIECNPEQGEYIEAVIHALETGEQVQKAYYVPEAVFTQGNIDEKALDRKY